MNKWTQIIDLKIADSVKIHYCLRHDVLANYKRSFKEKYTVSLLTALKEEKISQGLMDFVNRMYYMQRAHVRTVKLWIDFSIKKGFYEHAFQLFKGISK